MNDPLSIEQLRLEMGLTQDQFARKIGLGNKGSVSVIERGGPCSLSVALAIETLSAGRINAATLNADVAAARRAVIDDQSEPGSWADAIAHSPNLRVDDHRTHDATSAVDDETGPPLPLRAIICDVCERRVDGAIPNACTFVDCPHAQRIAA